MSVTPAAVSAEIPLEEAQAGDIVLCSDVGAVAAAIRFGQRFRVPKAYCWTNHVAVLTDRDADGWFVVEATGHGVERNALDCAGRHGFVVVNTGVDEAHRSQVVSFALSQVGQRYGWLTIASIVLDLLTPARLNLQRARTWICSALAARSVEHGGRLYDDVSPFQIMPAQLAQRYGVTA